MDIGFSGWIFLACVTAFIGFLIIRRTIQPKSIQDEPLLRQITQLTSECDRLNDRSIFYRTRCDELESDIKKLHGSLAEEIKYRSIAETKAQRLDQTEALLIKTQHDLTHCQTHAQELKTTLAKEREAWDNQIATLRDLQQQFTHQFQALSAQALEKNNQSFLTLAKESLDKAKSNANQDIQMQKKAVEDLVKPIKDALNAVDIKIKDLEKERLGAYEVLKQQVGDLITTQKELRTETGNLVKALRAPIVRGRWGEIQLRRVIEMAGMIPYCDFIEQHSIDGDEGRLRPDVIIRLPGDKKIIIDAKAPLSGYLDALDAPDETTRLAKLKTHARHVKQHIAALGSRAYWDQPALAPTPEFVILFLPGETFFSAALEQDPSLIEMGANEKVILATPTTLIALLRTVAYGWRQENMAQNAIMINELGKELYKRLSDMTNHMSKLGRHLGTAVQTYNQAIGTIESRVLVSARKFKDFSTVSDKIQIPVLEPVENSIRDDYSEN